MIESSNGMSQSQDTSSQSGLTPSAPMSEKSAPTASEERSFRQSEVNEIVKRAKHGAVEDFRRLQSEQPNYAQQKYSDNAPSQPTQQHQNSQSAVPEQSEIRRIAAEETQRLRDQWMNEARSKSEEEYAQRTVQNFWDKISPGKEKYQDFDQVTGDIEYARFPNVVQLLADHVDNSHDILYELGKDRIKMANLEQLAHMSPKDAIIQAKRLSQSLKDNESAGKIRIPNEPLSQLRPSNTGTDNGAMSVSDYRRKYKV